MEVDTLPDTPTSPQWAPHRIPFSIHKYSSFSGSYNPSHILEDLPNDPNSRWSSSTNSSTEEFLILKLQKNSIIETITFGKHNKPHVCNLKRFKVFGGLNDNNFPLLLFEGGLRNDDIGENFVVSKEIDSFLYPIRYIKIIPIQSFGNSYNFSIWFVELMGNSESSLVNEALHRFQSYREREAMRVCLKHLRDNNFLEAVDALLAKTQIELEDPLLSQFHSILVRDGEFIKAEEFIDQNTELFQEYINLQNYQQLWNQIVPESLERPGPRGGHQLVMDAEGNRVFLFGGWSGESDLADFWAFDLNTNKWNKLSNNTKLEGGPSARSCHKMVLNPNTKQIFMLGRYLDSGARPNRQLLKSDFYMYDIKRNEWSLLCDNTGAVGGPSLVFDHNLALDPKDEVIWMFGGRILSTGDNLHLDLLPGHGGGGGREPIGIEEAMNQEEEALPGPGLVPGLPPPFQQQQDLQALEDEQLQRQQMLQAARNIVNNQYIGVPADIDADVVEIPPEPSPVLRGLSSSSSELSYSGLYAYSIRSKTWRQIELPKRIKSRVGHSLVLDPIGRKIWIFGGQRQKESLNDIFTINIDTHEIEIISDGRKNQGLPPEFTQRATISPLLNEIYIFSGLSKDKEKRSENANFIYIYSIERRNFNSVLRNDGEGEPCARFAHALVYNPKTRLHYLFGGNPGSKDSKLRLEDFYCLRLCRPTAEEISKQCKLLLRREKYFELSKSSPLEAMKYLQNEVSSLIDHLDHSQVEEFQSLAHLLFEESTIDPNEIMKQRSLVFDRIMKFFPQKMTQPTKNLIDLL